MTKYWVQVKTPCALELVKNKNHCISNDTVLAQSDYHKPNFQVYKQLVEAKKQKTKTNKQTNKQKKKKKKKTLTTKLNH